MRSVWLVSSRQELYLIPACNWLPSAVMVLQSLPITCKTYFFCVCVSVYNIKSDNDNRQRIHNARSGL